MNRYIMLFFAIALTVNLYGANKATNNSEENTLQALPYYGEKIDYKPSNDTQLTNTQIQTAADAADARSAARLNTERLNDAARLNPTRHAARDAAR